MSLPNSDALAFGLIAWLESTRIALPLKLVECRFRVDGPFAHVEIDQVFRQTHSAPLDCRYTFPLPDAAAVHRCEMHVNERIVRARVAELEKAREQFAQAKEAGHRAALVETDRPNLFTLQLGNLQPGDLVVMRLAYVQTLERIAGELRLRIPLTPGVRYIPGKPLLRSNRGPGTVDDTDQVPDASRLTPPRIDALHEGAAIFALSGRLNAADVADGSLSSPTHPLLVAREAEFYGVELAEHGATPDRDAVIRWDEREATQLETRVHLLPARGEEKNDYALLQLRPPATSPTESTKGGGMDFYFLLDRSGSMEGLKWKRACAALRGFVDRLPEKDRVHVTAFESTHQDFSEAPMEAGKLRRDANFRSLENIGTAGGTELVPAAEHLFQVRARHSKGRRCTFVVLTDGQVGNESSVLECFRGQADIVVHTIGIDDAVNDSLLRRLARRQGGECWLITPTEDITGVVSALGARLGRPVLSGLRLTGAKWHTADPDMPLPDLYAGQTREILLSAPAGSKPPQLTADGGVKLSPAALRSGNDAIRLAWVRSRIEELESAGDRAGALQLALAHNVLCEGAAFIAWDESEKVPVATSELYQPSMVAEEAYDLCRTGAMAIPPLMMPSPAPMAPPPPPAPARSPITVRFSLRSQSEGGPAAAKKTSLIGRLSAPFRKRSAAPGGAPGATPMQFAEASEMVAGKAAQPVDELAVILGPGGDESRLSAWLQEAGLGAAAAEALAPVMLAWLRRGPGEAGERQARLTDWREALRVSDRKLALCLDFLRVDLAGQPGADAAKKALQELRRQGVEA